MRHLLLIALAAVAAAAPAAGAQTPDAFPAYERTLDDVGTWDAVLIGRDAYGRRIYRKGVEVNTLGCGGSCVESRVDGLEDIPPPSAGNAWPNTYDVVPPGTQLGALQIGLPPLLAEGDKTIHAPSRRPAEPRASKRQVFLGPPASRTSVEYSGRNRRTVVFYEQPPSGEEIAVLRIIYTRRK